MGTGLRPCKTKSSGEGRGDGCAAGRVCSMPLSGILGNGQDNFYIMCLFSLKEKFNIPNPHSSQFLPFKCWHQSHQVVLSPNPGVILTFSFPYAHIQQKSHHLLLSKCILNSSIYLFHRDYSSSGLSTCLRSFQLILHTAVECSFYERNHTISCLCLDIL